MWLLWLALLLPIAQVTASWHALSHAGVSAPGAPDPQHVPHVTHCDLCLTGAAIDSAAPLAEAPLPVLGRAHHELPQAALVTAWVASCAHAYLSRAPPIASS